MNLLKLLSGEGFLWSCLARSKRFASLLTTPGPATEVERALVVGISSTDSPDDPALIELLKEITQHIQDDKLEAFEDLSGLESGLRHDIQRFLPMLLDLNALGRGGENEFVGSSVQKDDQGRAMLGDFRVVREIGRGGVGVVYEAEQASLGRRVALKILPAAATLDRNAVQRFHLEAQVAGLLQHPRIVPVYGVGVIDRIPYLAMQFVEGGSVANLVDELRALKRGGVGEDQTGTSPLRSLAASMLAVNAARPVKKSASPGARTPKDGAARTARAMASYPLAYAVARLGIQAAEALGFAHERGVTHRDVKPSNLLLDEKGMLQVADFGMAAVRGIVGPTETGELPGTLRYMSPEQALGRRTQVDHRTDIYALGITLYELLTLEPAYDGTDRQQVLQQVVEKEPTALHRLDPRIPVDLATIVAKAIAKDRAGRYATAYELAGDLGRFLMGQPVAARPVGRGRRAWRWCRRHPLQAALAASLLSGMSIAGWGWSEAERKGRLLVLSETKARKEAAKLASLHTLIIDRATSQTPATVINEPAIEAAAQVVLGRVYDGMSDLAQSELHFRLACDLFARCADALDPERFEAEYLRGGVLRRLGRLEEAEAIFESLSKRSSIMPNLSQNLSIMATASYGEVLKLRRQFGKSERIYRDCLEVSRRASPPDLRLTLGVQFDLAGVLYDANKLEEAEATYWRTYQECKDGLGANHLLTLSTMLNLADIEKQLDKDAVSESLLRELLHRSVCLPGKNDLMILLAKHNLAIVLMKLKKDADAERAYLDALEGYRAHYGAERPETLNVTREVAGFLFNHNRLDDGQTLLRGCLTNQQRILGSEHGDTKKSLDLLTQMIKARR